MCGAGITGYVCVGCSWGACACGGCRCVQLCTVMYGHVRGDVCGCTPMYARGRCGDEMIEDYRIESFGNIEGFFLFRGVRNKGR